MLKTEYDALMGYISTEDEYVFANAIYMMCDLDKRSFCSIWKNPAVREMMDPIFNKIDSLEKEVDKLKKDVNKRESLCRNLFNYAVRLKVCILRVL